MDDDEIVDEFLVESHENLDQLDRDLVELEQQPGSRDLLSSIFRTIHTIKGTSGFLGFERLEALTHRGESLLVRLRDGVAAMDPPTADVLLLMVDVTRALLRSIEQERHDRDERIGVEAVVARLDAVLAGEPAPEPADATLHETVDPAIEEPPEPEANHDVAAGEIVTSGIADSSIRVDVHLLDDLVQLVGELVLTRNQIMQSSGGRADADLGRAVQRLDVVASELQENVMRTRMQPIGQVWAKMPRIVRDLAQQLGREVELDMSGHDTELDRTLLEALRGPLTHLIRNALDHGIEPPDERMAAGKPRTGRVSLRAHHHSGHVVVEITDDGRGIDHERVAAVAVERGVVTRDQIAGMTRRDIIDLVFRAGFSTASTVSNVSGRGVGMDVVRTNIEGIGGTVDVSTDRGSGTTWRVRIPLTLAIIPALVVAQGAERYAIAQSQLVELVRIDADDLDHQVEHLAGAAVLRLRGHLLPLVDLGQVLGEPPRERGALTIVVVHVDDMPFGLCVDDVHDTQEIVVKPIGRVLKDVPLYAGATIMGDGRVALILDIAGLADTAGARQTADAVERIRPPADSEVELDVDDEMSLLLLDVARQRAAMALTDVARLEEIPSASIERSGDVEVVQYRDGILPLTRLHASVGRVTDDAPADLSVVVHERDGKRVGIVIDAVVDIVSCAVQPSSVGRRDGVLGTAIIEGRITELIDLPAVVAAVEVAS